MAKAKTASFYIRRLVDTSANTANTTTIDTSAYVDPADRQGIMIEHVDYIFYDTSTNLPFTRSSDLETAVQMLTGEYTVLQPYNDEDLISSAGMRIDGGAGAYNVNDVYPDVLGTPDGRIVVDDSITLVGKSSASAPNMMCAVLIKAKVVTLSNKDYMALALQTVAN